MALTAEQKARCEEWCKSHFWQVLNRSEWKYEFATRTLVRYVDEIKMNEDPVEALLEYLVSPDCADTLRLYQQPVGEGWTPYRAWLEPSGKAAGSVRSVRLCHGLTTDVDGADGPYLVEDGCVSKVEWTYYWNKASVIPAPASSSGVSYRIANLSRSQETGLFTYALEKRTRVQQDILYTASDDAQGKTTVEQHLGVREGQKAQYEAKVGVQPDGTVTTLSESKNPDCTSDLTLRSEKRAQNDRQGESCSDTLFEKQHSTSTQAAADYVPGSHVPAASGGITHSRSARKGADGKWDVQESTSTEHPVERASESVAATLRGTERTVSHRNQPGPYPTDNLPIGTSVRNEKTPGGLFNQTIRTFVATVVGWLRRSCSMTIFSHQHSESRNQGADPGFTHVSAAGGGRIRETTVTKTENGTFDVTDAETVELPVPQSSVSARRTLRGLQTSVTDRNVGEPYDTANLPVGVSVQNDRTPGGLWNRVRTSLAVVFAGIIRRGCSQTAFIHTDTRLETVAEDPGFDHVEAASGGVTHEINVTHNDDGSFDVASATHVEIPGVLARSQAATWEGRTDSVTTRGNDGDVTCPIQVGSVTHKSARKTQGALQDLTVVTETAGPPVSWVKDWDDASTHYRMVFFRNLPSAPNPTDYMFGDYDCQVAYHPTLNRYQLYDGTLMISYRRNQKQEGALWLKMGVEIKPEPGSFVVVDISKRMSAANISAKRTYLKAQVYLRRYYVVGLYSSSNAAFKAYHTNGDVGRYPQDGGFLRGNTLKIYTTDWPSKYDIKWNVNRAAGTATAQVTGEDASSVFLKSQVYTVNATD